MTTSMWIASLIFIFTLVMIATEKIHKTLAALLGGCLMLLSSLFVEHASTAPLDLEQKLFGAVDLNVILLLMGMMIIVHVISQTGFLEWVALETVRFCKGRPFRIMAIMALVTAVLSAFLDNVTTILVIAPITLLITRRLELDPVPFLLTEVLASNIGGAATLIGDPPNLLIGSKVGLSFNDFIVHMTPFIVINLVAYIITLRLFFGKRLTVSADARARILEMDPKRAITDRALLRTSLIVFGATILGFLLHDFLGLKPATIALTGAVILMVIVRTKPEEAFKAVEWSTLFFIIGLFMCVEGLVQTGVIKAVAGVITDVTQGNRTATAFGTLWFSSIGSSLVSAVPMTTTLIPVIQEIAGDESFLRVLCWALAIGACPGANATIIGHLANVITVDISHKHKYPITFWRFMKYGIPFTLQSLLIATVYLYARYLM